MRAWFHSWQQKTSKMMKIVQIGVLLAVIALFVLFILGYIFNWTWTGVGSYVSPIHPQGSDFQREKTLYDWFQLAIIPVALAVGVWWLNRVQQQRDQQLADQRAQTEREAAEKRAQTEREIALGNQREAALQAYINKMSELLLQQDLCRSNPDAEARIVARVLTLTVLPRLDGERKARVLQFLYESKLIGKDNRIVDLDGADFREAELSFAVLHGADLHGADLSKAELLFTNLLGAKLNQASFREANMTGARLNEASLSGASLSGADLHGIFLEATFLEMADLREADLEIAHLHGAYLIQADLRKATLIQADLSEANLLGAYLHYANLSEANLFGAKVTDDQLKQAKSLQGATMPDGTKHA